MPKKPPAKALPTKQSILRIVVLLLSLAALALCARILEQAPRADVLEEGDDAVVEGGSGSQAEAKEAALRAWEEKKEKSENFRKLFTEVQSTRDSIHAQIENAEKRRVQNRSTCATDLRQANKHTQLPIALRCYRGELNLHIDILRKERNLLENMPLSSEELQTESLQVLDALIDAMSSIVNAIEKAIMGIVTDSSGPTDPKDPETCVVYQIHKLLLSESDAKALADEYRNGIGYGDAKKKLFSAYMDYFATMRQTREKLTDKYIAEVLASGAKKAQGIAGPTMEKVRQATGLS